MPAKRKKINLLPQEEFETSTLGRILRWTLSGFRLIVIITEMIVMTAFLSRFWLDAKTSDLNEEIKQKEAQILAYKDVENQFRTLQNKLNIFNKLSLEKQKSTLLESIASTIPIDLTLASITVSDTGLLIKGLAWSELSVSQFMANLSAKEVFPKVTLNQTSSSTENPGQIIFNIKID